MYVNYNELNSDVCNKGIIYKVLEKFRRKVRFLFWKRKVLKKRGYLN